MLATLLDLKLSHDSLQGDLSIGANHFAHFGSLHNIRAQLYRLAFRT